jgi:hypothetical protein
MIFFLIIYCFLYACLFLLSYNKIKNKFQQVIYGNTWAIYYSYIFNIFESKLSKHIFYEKLAFMILISCEEKYSGKKNLKKKTQETIFICVEKIV